MRDDTILVSVMAANNEIGVLQPIAELAAIAREAGALFHTDAAQAATKVPFDVADLGVDQASLSAHKCYGPKGIGALFVRTRHARPAPLFYGGGHESGLRSGTLPVPLIVGFGKAVEIGAAECRQEAATLTQLRGRLWKTLHDTLGDEIAVNGDLERRVPGNLNVSIRGLDAALLVAELRDVALSVGSACSSAKAQPSHVLKALGLPDEAIRGSFRIGLGRETTSAEVDRAAARILEGVGLLRQAAPAGRLRRRPDFGSAAGNLE